MTDAIPLLSAVTALVVAVTALVTSLRTRRAVTSAVGIRSGRSGTVTRWEAPTGERVTVESRSETPPPPAASEAPAPPPAPPVPGGA